MNNKYPVIM